MASPVHHGRVKGLRSALATILLVVAGALAATPAYGAATPPANCGAHTELAPIEEAAQRKPHADGNYTPILLVHGWNGGNPGMWSEPINLSTLNIAPRVTSSLLGNLQKLAGAAVYTVDYSDVAKKFFLEDGSGAPRVIEAMNCLAENAAFRGHKTVVVAHSMGGLITRWSLSEAAPGGVERRGHVGLVVTLGTPYEGSLVSGLVTSLADEVAKVDKPTAALAATVHQLLALCHDVGNFPGCTDFVDFLSAMHSFAPGSPEMRSLAVWPEGTEVNTLASRTIVETGLFFAKGPEMDLGDVIVPTSSATSGDHAERVAECRVTSSLKQSAWDNLLGALNRKADIDVRQYWLLSLLGTCYHSNAARVIQHTNEVLGLVAEYLARGEPLYAYAGDKELAVVRGSGVSLRTSGPITSEVRWTADGRYAFAAGSDGYLYVLGTEASKVRCRCTDVVPVTGSTVAWADSGGKVTLQDLASGSSRTLETTLPSGKKTAVAGADGGFAVLTRSGGGGTLSWVTESGQTRAIEKFPELTEPMAIAAGDGKLVYQVIASQGDCAHPGPIRTADIAGGAPTTTNAATLATDNAEVFLNDAWQGRDGRWYATMTSYLCDPYGGIPMMPSSLWRLDDGRWVSVDGGPVGAVRQLSKSFKAVVVPDGGKLYSEINGKGTKIASNVRSIAAPPGNDPIASPTGKPRGAATGPCLTRDAFAKRVDTLGPGIFEGSDVNLKVTGAVVCQAGFAYAPVQGTTGIDWVVLHYQERQWSWSLDPYWHPDRAEVCESVPGRIGAAIGC
ncbi:lipase family alpha/beta hydrolase [Micromonospora sp. NPDC051006]|uniref:lipase family alpha/beta hydrolase n=1 Tax=Micromonospora sp. NPDC051006 TaxID=3364283 RepID=UPI0037AEAAF1